MYQQYFKLRSAPFSIAPDPEFLFMSEGHKEALAHLSYVLQQSGGFVLLTGEVGTGKTTVCRTFIKTLPPHVCLAYIINPKISGLELLISIAKELDIPAPENRQESRLAWQEVIYEKLLYLHSMGKQTLLMIDEAQNLAPDVLEEVRLLTNLETDKEKLLSIILMGQPELRDILGHHQLRQLNQRITARFHLNPLTRKQVGAYLMHRLNVAGGEVPVFSAVAQCKLHKLSGGVPRLINVLADRSMLAAYVNEEERIGSKLVANASKEVLPFKAKTVKSWKNSLLITIASLAFMYVLINPFNSSMIKYKIDQSSPSLFNQITNKIVGGAEAELADFWNIASAQKLCSAEGLACYRETLSGDDIKLLGHPFVSFNDNDAQWIPIDDLSLQSSKVQFDVLMLWQVPEGYKRPLKQGDRSDVVLWLRAQLPAEVVEPSLAGWEVMRPANIDEKIFDSSLVLRLKTFQRTQGITPDGILGPKTIMVINSVNGLLPGAKGGH
jgi:general secretion pathway protein A